MNDFSFPENQSLNEPQHVIKLSWSCDQNQLQNQKL